MVYGIWCLLARGQHHPHRDCWVVVSLREGAIENASGCVCVSQLWENATCSPTPAANAGGPPNLHPYMVYRCAGPIYSHPGALDGAGAPGSGCAARLAGAMVACVGSLAASRGSSFARWWLAWAGWRRLMAPALRPDSRARWWLAWAPDSRARCSGPQPCHLRYIVARPSGHPCALRYFKRRESRIYRK